MDRILALICVLSLLFLALPVVALVVALRALRRVDDLHNEVTRLRRAIQPPRSSAVPPPLTVTTAPPAPAADTPTPVFPVPAEEAPPAAPAAADKMADYLAHRAPAVLPSAQPPAAITPSAAAPVPRKPPKPSISREALVVRALVAIAGVAIALGGAYFVKLSFDNNWLQPPVRIGIGALFGLALLAAGEVLRSKAGRVATACVAAGVAVLFAVILAGMHVEHLIPAFAGFVLLAAVAAAAVVLSIRHGPYVALLGLIGGFATPALVGSSAHAPGQLFGYLFLLEIGLAAITRWRRWWWLTLLTLAAGYGWVVLWMLLFYAPGDSTALGLFLVGTSAAFVLTTRRDRPADSAGLDLADLVRWAGAAVGLILMATLVQLGHFTWQEWGYFGILGAGALALARLDPPRHALAWLALGASIACLAGWKLSGGAAQDPHLVIGVCAGLYVLYGLGGYACLWGATRAAFFAALSATATVAGFVLLYLLIPDRPAYAFGGLALALVGVEAVLIRPVIRRRGEILAGNAALAALGVAGAALLALAVPIELKEQWIAVAWALLLVGVVLIDRWLEVRALRTLVALLGVLVALRLLANPGVVGYPVGSWPVLNWILYGYGIPAAAAATAAHLYRRQGPRALVGFLHALAVVLTLALATLEVRHFFHRQEMWRTGQTFIELGTYSVLGLGAAGVLSSVGARLPRTIFHLAGIVVLAATLVFTAFILLGMVNPLWSDTPVRGVLVFNDLLYVYGLPTALLLGLTWMHQRRGDAALAALTSAAALVLLVALVTLQLRYGFHPSDMTGTNAHRSSLVELATYPIAWYLLALGLLAAAWLRGPTAFLVVSGLILAVLAAGVMGLVTGLVENPVWNAQAVGPWPVLNWLLYIYGVPLLELAALAWLLDRLKQRGWFLATAILALGWLFLLLNLEVRQAFRGRYLDTGLFSDSERYAYSAAWVILGVVLLVAGIARRSLLLRWASLVVMLLTVGKTFLDVLNLRDIYRVISLVGLGLALLLLGYLYHRFVFREAGAAPDGTTAVAAVKGVN